MTMSINKLDEVSLNDRKTLKEISKNISNLSKRICQGIEFGDLKNATSALRKITDILPIQNEIYESLSAKLAQFDYSVYMREIFPQEFINACQCENIPVRGTFPSYDVFPFLVQIDNKNNCVIVNGRRVTKIRPSVLIEEIKKEQLSLSKLSFNAREFLRDLAAAYDKLALQKKGEHELKFQGDPIPIKQIYATLAPLKKWKKEYPIRFFAFDIHRLLKSELREIDGREYEFGSSRDIRKAIRILDNLGKERFVASIKFQPIRR